MLVTPNSEYRLGCHIQKYASFAKTIKTQILGTERGAAQLYCCNGRGYALPKLELKDITKARELLSYRSNFYLNIHSSLIYNLCGCTKLEADPSYEYKRSGTIKGLNAELDVAVALSGNISPGNVSEGVLADVGCVVHIGSCVDKHRGIREIQKSIIQTLEMETEYTWRIAKEYGLSVTDVKKSRKVILENAAGEGDKIGSTLKEIKLCIPKSHESQVKVCIDTAHIFGAGEYDFGSIDEIDRFYMDFDKEIGIDRLDLFHMNDSEVPFGSKKDRHECLGAGYIFSYDDSERIDALRHFVECSKKYSIPLISEQPRARNGQTKEINTLRCLGWEKTDYALMKMIVDDVEIPF